MFCAISGEIPQDAVVSKKTGQLFEKRIVTKYIADGGRCPLTGEELTEQDLLEVKASKCLRPRSVAGNSIPGMIANFQAEWDEVMLETFTLKQHLDATRKELSQALYQHDAACRVIARLIKERDEARGMLAARMGGAQGEYPMAAAASASASATAVAPDGASSQMETEDSSGAAAASAAAGALEASVMEVINAKCAELSATRKGRKAADISGLATKELLASADNGMKTKASFTPHKSDKPGVTCLAVSPAAMNGHVGDGVSSYALTGGVDKTALLVDTRSGAVEGKLTGHTKKVSAVAFHPSFDEAAPHSTPLYTASADGTVKIWEAGAGKKSAQYKVKHSFDHHAGHDVSGLTVHPSGHFAISTSADSSWAFLDLNEGKVLRQMYDTAGSSTQSGGYSCGSFHPDGLILATGGESSNGVVKIFDVREQSEVAVFTDHTDRINAVTFSENGYILSTASNDGTVKIWDLRKLKSTKSIEMVDKAAATSLAFDYSASFLAIGCGNAVRLLTTGKEWADIASFESHSKAVMGVGWGNRTATQLVTCSMDRSIKVHELGSA